MRFEKFTAGFHGHDSMRDKAMKMLGPELRATNMRTPSSMSAPSKTKMRPFRQGGHAHRQALTQEQRDLHIPKKVAVRPFRKAEGGEMRAEGDTLRCGGHAKNHGAHHRKYTKDGHPKFGIGGFFGNLMRSIPLVNMITGPIADAAHLKKGGRARHKHRAEGGLMMQEPDLIANAKQRWLLNHPDGGLFAKGGEAKRRGGRMHRKHRAEGGKPKFGIGGGIGFGGGPGIGGDLMMAYKGFSPETRERVNNVGRSLFNVGKAALGYADGGHTKSENMRRGGHHKGRRKYGLGGMIAGAAGAPLLEKIPKVGKYMAQNLGMFGGFLPFAEGGEAKRCGGRMHRKHHAEGGQTPFSDEEPIQRAAGGAGKVRHRQATSDGRQIHHRRIMRRG